MVSSIRVRRWVSPPPIRNSAKLNGIFFAVSKIKAKDITDGTSHTAMVSELILSPDEIDDDIRGRYYNPCGGAANFTDVVSSKHIRAGQDQLAFGAPVPEAPASPARDALRRICICRREAYMWAESTCWPPMARSISYPMKSIRWCTEVSAVAMAVKKDRCHEWYPLSSTDESFALLTCILNRYERVGELVILEHGR